MTANQAKTEFRAGRITVEQVLDEFAATEKRVRRLEGEVERLKQRLAQYEPEIENDTPGNDSTSSTPSMPYSLEAEEKRGGRGPKKKKSPGRRPTALKFAEAEDVQDIFPPDASRAECQLVRERAVWRLVDGRAVLIGYRIFRAPGGVEPRIPGVTWRCEYGIEILICLAFLVYIIGVSIEKACALLHFFCHLTISKSQADALLRQLSRYWDQEFDTLCDLLAAASVVYMDETGWKVGPENCSLWTFASQLQRVFIFGGRKDADTMDKILPPHVFDGIGVSDDAAVYRYRFSVGQKCWAHLLRKAIRLAMLYPQQKKYRRFLDELLAIYYDAKRRPINAWAPKAASNG